ncbi:MAG: hypothetical protein IKZ88_04365 [Neisseriaceae bacterium]|nr:hypothetical protein [Neisseriaceae bacterium]
MGWFKVEVFGRQRLGNLTKQRLLPCPTQDFLADEYLSFVNGWACS